MAERTTATQVVQIRKESVAGTDPTTGTKLLTSMSIDVTPAIETTPFTPTGHKFVALTSVGKDSTTAAIRGEATYTEIIYPLSALYGAVTPTTPAGGTTSKQWKWTASDTSVEDPQTFTVLQGSSVRAAKATYMHCDSFGVSFDRSKVDVSGSMIGQLFTDAAALDGSPTALALIPVLATQGDVYLDSTGAGIGATKLTRVISGSWNVSGKYAPGWFVNSANTSWAVPIEKAAKNEVKLKVEADATGMGELTKLRAGTTSFVRFAWTGATIESTVKYLLQIDLAVKWNAISPLSDSDGIYAVEFTGDVVQDATWTKSAEITVINLLTAL